MKNLEAISPALLGLAKRNLSSEDSIKLNDFAGLLLSQANLSEAPIHRPEGASFNPRAARLCEILVKDAGLKDFDALCIALLLGSDFLGSIDLKKDILTDEGKLALLQDTLDLLNNSAATTETALLIAGSYCLDQIRHLHMSSLTSEEKLLARDRARNISNQLQDNHIGQLLNVALDRYKER